MKVAKKNVEKRRGNYGNARPDVVIREAKRITMEDKIKTRLPDKDLQKELKLD